MKNFKEPDNCDPVLLCTSTDMKTNLGLVRGAYSSISQDTDNVEGKGKRQPDFVL